MPSSQGGTEAHSRDSLLHIIAALVFACLPLSVQAITLPVLSKAWKQRAQEEQRAKERTLEQAERLDCCGLGTYFSFYVPLWAAQQQERRQRGLSAAQKRRFQLRAAAHGDVGALDWLGVGAPEPYGVFHRTLCGTAARGGQLEALKWLRAKGCDWDKKNICTTAAWRGHLAVLEWARANGCDWDGLTGFEASRSGHPAVLQWLRANGCPGAG